MCLSLCLSQATISTFKRLFNLELNIGPEACHSFIDEHTFICLLFTLTYVNMLTFIFFFKKSIFTIFKVKNNCFVAVRYYLG